MAVKDSADLEGRTLGRFLIERRIGSGGMGVVYEARDQEHGTRVALKTLDHLEPEAIYRLKNEFRSLAGVLHPNLVHMHELARDGDAWFFVMDYVEGQPFLQHLRPEDTKDRQQVSAVEVIPRGPPSGREPAPAERRATPLEPDAEVYERLRQTLRGLLDGVEQLHSLGKLHRDLKPSNVLVTAGGRVVILDFGLTTTLEAAGAERQQRTARGTPLYMAPELFLGERATEATDLYAVGVMLFQALVGRPPFTGGSHQLVSEKLYTPVTPPAELVIGTPPELNEACVALLLADPRKRPTLGGLRRILGLEPPLGEGPPSVASTRPGQRRLDFVGRAEQLEQLERLWERARAGSSAIVTLTGESGLGKSALVEKFLSRRRDVGDASVFSGRCYEHESVPYKAFDQIADQLSSHLAGLPDEDLAQLTPPGAAALVTVFPVLARVVSFRFGDDEGLPADPTEVRLRALAAFRQLLARLAEQRTIILTIDDLQWSDHDSALVFKELFRKRSSPSLLVLLTCRETAPPALTPLLTEIERRPNPKLVRDHMPLSPLPESEALTLAQRAADIGRLDETSAHAIVKEAKGNPFFLVALSRHRDHDDSPPSSLPSFMQSWLESLPQQALELLRIIAISGRPLDEAALAALQPTRDLSSLLFLLSRNHFIGAWPTPTRRVECYHDRIREAVLTTLSNAEKQRLHAGLGNVLEALGGTDAETLANHFLEAGHATKGARYAERAADEAALAYAFFHAASFYERALHHTTDEDKRTTLRAKLGEAYACAGNGQAAAEHLLLAAKHCRGATALKLRQRAAELLLVCGHIDRGVATLDAVLDHIQMSLAKTPRRALLSLVAQRARVKFRGLAFTPKPSHELDDEALLRIDACWSVALGLSLVDPVRAADFQTRNLLLSLRAGDSYRIARALAMEAGFVAAGGSRSEKRARELSDLAAQLAAEVGDPHAIGLSTFTRGLARYLVSDWPEAIRLFDEAEAILTRVPGAIWELNAAQRFRINSQTYIGDLEAVRDSVPELLQSAIERGNLYSECALRVRGDTVILLAHDEPERALAETEEMMTRWSQEGFHLQHYNALWARCLCHIYRGDAETAMALIRQTWPQLEASLLTNTQAVRVESRYLRARVCLAYLAQNPHATEARRLLHRDIRALSREKVPWGTAFASLLSGLRLAGTKDDQARSFLARAEQEFERGAMRLLADVTRYRRGQITPGPTGERLTNAALDSLRALEVRVPERFIDQWAPLPCVDPATGVRK